MEPVREITERYRTEEVLASDGELTVCSATDATSGARVVVEVVAASQGATAGAAGRFLEAVAALARLRHASLPAVLDGGATDDGAVFLVREPIDGRPFHTLGGESPGQILSLLLQVVGGLELLAGERIFHGDLSLDSLWVAAGPDRPRAKILNLASGVWRSLGNGADPQAGLRDDVRSLGAVACRLLGATVSDPGSAAPRVKLPLAVSFELEDGEALRALLERCLRRDPAGRPGDYQEMRSGLCIALWGEAEAAQAPALGTSGAPPARLTFTTVPEDSLVEAAAAPPPPAVTPAAPPPSDEEGEITKVVFPEELEGWEDGEEVDDTADAGAQAPGAAPPASRVAVPDDVLRPITFIPTGDETLTEEPQAAPPPEGRAAPSWPMRPRPSAAGPSATPAAGGGGADAVATPAGAAGPSPGAGAPPAVAGASGRRRALIVVAVAAAAGLLLVLGLGAVALLWWTGRGEERAEAPPARPAAVAPSESQPGAEAPSPSPATADPRLVAALERFAAGEDAEAQRALAAIPAEDQAGFDPAECELLGLLGSSLDRVAEEQAAAALRTGLAAGDAARLRRATAAMAGREQAFLARYPAVAGDLEQARRALAVFERARAAVASGEPERVLEHTATLMAVFPAWEGARAMRDSAAGTIEGEVDALFEQGRYEAALERLEVLAAAWPDRDGLDRRRELVRTRLRTERDLGSLIAAAEQAGAEGRPDEGLALLAGVAPPERLAGSLAETRRQLEQRLEELDGAPPQVELLAGSGPEYSKDEAALIVFRVRDDFRIERVTVRARAAGGDWQAMPSRRRDGDARAGEYALEIGPDLHRNEAVEFYITATDPSGQEGAAGSAERPLELKRRRWFHRILPD